MKVSKNEKLVKIDKAINDKRNAYWTASVLTGITITIGAFSGSLFLFILFVPIVLFMFLILKEINKEIAKLEIAKLKGVRYVAKVK